MDKILSARVDEAVIREIGLIAHKLGATKKAVIEGAVRAYGEKVLGETEEDAFGRTFGAWKRDESPNETVQRARAAFRRSMERHSR